MKFPENIQQVADLQPDFLGFIFYAKSPRYAEPLSVEILAQLPKKIRKIGVFVNEDLEYILKTVFRYQMDGVQLHGSELETDCAKLKEAGLIVLKAFSVDDEFNFSVTKKYEDSCDYFVFDTKTPAYGGSGQKFNWNVLENYQGTTPFLLSGGLQAGDEDEINQLNHPAFAGVDLNSKFELSPGLKNVSALELFISNLEK